jgi:hypothetical protein
MIYKNANDEIRAFSEFLKLVEDAIRSRDEWCVRLEPVIDKIYGNKSLKQEQTLDTLHAEIRKSLSNMLLKQHLETRV